MHSRRHEEHGGISGSSKLHGRHRNELGSDPYKKPRHRSGSPPVHRRNFSPHRVDGIDRGLSMSKRSDPLERKDCDWNLGGGRRSRVQSRSPPPPVGQSRKRPHFDDEVMNRKYSPQLESRRRYDGSMNMDYNVDDQNLNCMQVHEYERGSSRMNSEKDFIDGKSGAAAIEHRIPDHKLRINEDERRGTYGLSQERGFTSRYGDTVAHAPLPSRNVSLQRFEYERLHQGDAPHSDKLPIKDPYNVGDKPLFHTMEMPYPDVSGPFVKDYACTPQVREFGSLSRSDFMSSYPVRAHLPDSNEPSRRYGKGAEPVGFDSYSRRLHAEVSEDPENYQRNETCYKKFKHSPHKSRHEEHLWSKSNVRPYDEPGYISGELHRNIPPRAHADYDEILIKHEIRESSRTNAIHPGLEATGNAEYFRGKGAVHDYSPLANQRFSDYAIRGISSALDEAEEYVGLEYDHHEISRAIPRVNDTSYLRPEYVSVRDSGLRLRQERFRTSPVSECDSEMLRDDIREHGMKKEPSFYDQLDGSLREEYRTVEGVDAYDSRLPLTGKRFAPEELQETYDRSEEWTKNDAINVLYSSHDVGPDYRVYRKNDREYYRIKNQEFSFNGRIGPQYSTNHSQMNSVGRYKHATRYTKAYPKSATFKLGKSQQFSRTGDIHKQPKLWKQIDDNVDDIYENDDKLDDDWADPAETEPPEGSEEFKQLVHEAFLVYSKMVNINISVQRRYKEQGKAGALFCIVCGRSVSKEFKDTRSLVTHAFMSRKVGLRAKHLGLHKAICVLLGWDTAVPPDTITWAPQVLPRAEALCQKEDLILWPPLVIIHNISFFDNNPENWRVISIETIEAFLRGEGFIRGRIKVCLGKPADQSTILVKFLGTFSGVGDAERLHKYFADSNRGRVDFERAKVNNSSGYKRERKHGDKLDRILHGYFGIAEDLDKVDFNTRKRILIKSKQEIKDLENAPIKTEHV